MFYSIIFALYIICVSITFIEAFYSAKLVTSTPITKLYSNTLQLKSPVSSISSLPSFQLIKREANRTIKNSISKDYCRKTAGYPNINVKYAIYLNVWASLKHSQDIQQKKIKTIREICYHKDELETFGLI